MATFRAGTDASFDIKVLSYAYDASADGGDHSANWLNIRSVGTDGHHTWELEGDWCTTWELLELTLWLDAVAAGNFNLWSTSGVEPWPDFDAHWEPPARPMISVKTAHRTADANEAVTIWFPYDPASLRAFAAQLSIELEPFPIRRVENGGPADSFIARLADYRLNNTLHTLAQRKDRTLPRYIHA